MGLIRVDMSKCPVVEDEWEHYDPDGVLLFTTTTLHCVKSLYLRAEIAENLIPGYYIKHNGSRIDIQPDGCINMTAGELKDKYSDLMMEQLIRINNVRNKRRFEQGGVNIAV